MVESSNGSEWTMYSLLLKLTADTAGKIEILKSINTSIDRLDAKGGEDSIRSFKDVIGDLEKNVAHDNLEVKTLAADAICNFARIGLGNSSSINPLNEVIILQGSKEPVKAAVSALECLIKIGIGGHSSIVSLNQLLSGDDYELRSMAVLTLDGLAKKGIGETTSFDKLKELMINDHQLKESAESAVMSLRNIGIGMSDDDRSKSEVEFQVLEMVESIEPESSDLTYEAPPQLSTDLESSDDLEGLIDEDDCSGPQVSADCIKVVRKERICEICKCPIHVGERAYIRYKKGGNVVRCLPCNQKRFNGWSAARDPEPHKARILELLRAGPKSAIELREDLGNGYCNYVRKLMMDGYPIIKIRRTENSVDNSTTIYSLDQITPTNLDAGYPLDDENLDRMLMTMRQSIAVDLTKQIFKLHGYQIGAAELTDPESGAVGESDEGNIPDYLVSNDGKIWNKFIVRCGPNDSLQSRNYDISDSELSTYVINVSSNSVSCMTLKEMAGGETITPLSPNHLADRHELRLNRDKTITLCDYVCKFVHGTG